MAAGLEELAYDLAWEALREQDRALDELRSRTGTLLATAAVVTSLLGAQTLHAVGFDWAIVIAICGFGATSILSVYILFLRRRVARSIRRARVYEYFVSKDVGLSEARRQLAY